MTDVTRARHILCTDESLGWFAGSMYSLSQDNQFSVGQRSFCTWWRIVFVLLFFLSIIIHCCPMGMKQSKRDQHIIAMTLERTSPSPSHPCVLPLFCTCRLVIYKSDGLQLLTLRGDTQSESFDPDDLILMVEPCLPRRWRFWGAVCFHPVKELDLTPQHNVVGPPIHLEADRTRDGAGRDRKGSQRHRGSHHVMWRL